MRNTRGNIIATLRSGPLSAAEIAARLQIASSTVSRNLNAITDKVIKAGEGRATKWHLIRPVAPLAGAWQWPIYRVNASGNTEKIAHLYSVYPAESYLVEYFRSNNIPNLQLSFGEWTFYESLPWWLTDMRPQGFLGRSLAQQLHKQGEHFNVDPRQWHEDQVLAVLVRFPQDHIGNLLVGESAYQLWQQRDQHQKISDAQAAALAEAIANGEHFESSAQGEQPKFMARLAEGDCLVKFSGAITQVQLDSVANRWADLLQAEALAATILNNNFARIAAPSRCWQANQRTFMASLRFDRNNAGGRKGVISFTSLDAEFVGKGSEPWPVIVNSLYQQGIVSEQAVSQCKIAWAFGQLIANSDMHLGNISVMSSGSRPYEIAPIYDMLPMHFAPTPAGDLPSKPRAIPQHPAVAPLYWQMALPVAQQFWQAVLLHPQISTHFKVLAAQQQQLLTHLHQE